MGRQSVCMLPSTHMALSALPQGNPQSFHKVNFTVLCLTKTCFSEAWIRLLEFLEYAVDFSWLVKNFFISVQIVLKYSVAEDSLYSQM
jgi:hypothetical protein